MTIMGSLVVLEEIKETYLEQMVKWRNDPDVSKFMFDQGIFTIENQIKWYQNLIKDDTRKQFIILAKKNGLPIGAINLMNIDSINCHADWGYYIGEKAFRMGGYSVEAEYLLLDYSFNTLNLNKIYCQTLSNNMKVVSNHKKFGFSVDGVLRQHHFDGNKFLDIYIMSIIKDEFFTVKPEILKLLEIFNR